MAPARFLEHSLKTRLLAAALLIVGVWAAWVAWGRFRRQGGADFDSGLVQSFLEARFAALSNGVYHVRLGRISFDLEHQSARVDSALITTDTAANQRRAHPLPVLNAVLRVAEVRGLVRDADGQGISIDEIRFSRVDADLTFPPPDTVVALPTAADTGAAFVSWTLHLPVGAPQIRIGRLVFEGVTAVVRPAPGTGGRQQEVEHLSLVLDSVRLDRQIEGLHLPVVVNDIRMTLTDYTGGWDSVSTISVGRLQGSFRDSTLTGYDFSLAPTRTIAQVLHRRRLRRERFTLDVDTLRARGVDWSAVLREGAIPLRMVQIDGADLLIYTDQRLAARPTPRPRTPLLQENLRAFGRPIAIDTAEVRRGRLRYKVRAAVGDGTGEVDFEDVDARLTGLRWRPRVPNTGEAVLTLHARLWGVAPMRLTIRGPLGSTGPRADVDLFVGAMPMTLANAIVPAIDPFDIKSGVLDSVTVFVSITGDTATGEARPFYHDLAVRGRSSGGFFARLARGASEVIANSFMVRDDNPGRNGDVMFGPIVHRREPWQTFWPYVWGSTREALSLVGRGKGVEVHP